MNVNTPPPNRFLLLVAPHRGMFLLGMTQCVLAMLPWWLEMVLRSRGGGLSWPWPPVWWHALTLIYGVFPFFIFGFALTAMPRWQSYGDLPPARYAGPWWALAAGWALIYAGFVWPAVGVAGLVLVALGWAGVCATLLPVALRPGRGRIHALPVWLAMLAGLFGVVLLIALAIDGDGRWAMWAIDVGVWAFLLPTFLCVCHRMVPFFSNAVLPGYTMVRPAWVLFALLAGALAHGVLQRASLAEWRWLVDVPMAAIGVWLSVRWGLRRSFAVPLLAMLHMGFAWFGIAMTLFAIQSALLWWGVPVLGLAPVHALVIGMFAVLMLGMVSRVTLGHSGAALSADALTWRLSWALQAVALLRVLAEILPGYAVWLVLAASVWLAVFVSWGLRYLPVYLRPRVDGREG